MTREEDLTRIAKKLEKMVSRNNTVSRAGHPQVARCVVLCETRIGMSVNSIRKHCPDEEVVALAKILIKEWKRLLGMSCVAPLHFRRGVLDSSILYPSRFPSPPRPARPPLPIKRPSVDGKRERSASREAVKGKTETPKTPTTPTSPMSPGLASGGGPLSPHLTTGDSVRDKCIEMLAAALRTDNDYKDFGTNCDSMAAEIEDHILQFGQICATDMKYKNRVRSRISNLKDPKNPGLRRNVLVGSIDLKRIAIMSAEEMASDELKQLRNVLTQEAIREHQMAKTGGTTTDLLQCGKCKKKNCTYNQVQTRSADEPMTTFVLCNECGNRWKFC
uniref:Transcription elongation factor n=1 Tax=Hippocampus comes TaxID=109280 RepID=A0A3Q2YQI2_HIPCM